MAKRETLELRVGDEHSLALEGLMTAGYVWEPELLGDDSVAEVTKAHGAKGGPDRGVGGAPAEVFTIRALKPGTSTVRFAQRRPWDPAAQAGELVVDLRVAD
jgi:predicted secreted protein